MEPEDIAASMTIEQKAEQIVQPIQYTFEEKQKTRAEEGRMSVTAPTLIRYPETFPPNCIRQINIIAALYKSGFNISTMELKQAAKCGMI